MRLTKTGESTALRGAFAGDDVRTDLLAFAATAPPHTRLRSVRALAGDYQVSHSTVKRVLDDLAADGVVYTRRGRGCFVAETPATNARTVLYLDSIGQAQHPFWARRLQGVTRQAEVDDLRLQILEHRGLLLEHAAFLREVARQDVRGVILPWLDDHIYEKLKALNPALKLVALGTPGVAVDVGSVWLDETGAAKTAINYLARLGATRVVCCTRSRQFLAAAEDEAENAFHPVDLMPLYTGDAGCGAGTVTAALAAAPDGVVFSDDRDATMFIDAACSRQPQFLTRTRTIALSNRGEQLLPAATHRLEFDGHDLGATAVRLLAEMLSSAEVPPLSIRVAPRLVPGTPQTQS
jgi:DNA-binding LacI/PurR family transcriptional regulator